MYIENIEFKNFRNYESLNLTFNKNVNIIIGNNAQGKTNLIEGIYFTSVGKSFRTSKDSELINFNEERALVKVEAVKEYLETTVEIIVNKSSKKAIKKDGVNLKKLSELIENILVVIFSPEDLKIVKDEPEKRRKFIDRELCQIMPSYYDNISNYKKILAQRNFYLKENYVDEKLVDLWDIQLAGYGAKIIKQRNNFIDKLNSISKEIHNGITNGRESLILKYNPNVKYIENLKEQEEYFYSILKKNFQKDIMRRTTSSGPHKDDLDFFVNEVNMRSFGSQGQQRTCALSLKLAELNIIKEETGEEAILLLDDVMSELDIQRQEFLIKSLKNNQLFITTTHIDDRIKNSFPDGKIIEIKNGKILE